MYKEILDWFKTEKKQTEDSSPETYEEAIEYVAARIEPETVTHPFFHHTGGMHVRNTLGLWDKESKLHKHMLARFGLCHADDTGGLITRAAHALKNGDFYDPQEDVASFKAHWLRSGFDPATMEKIKEKK